MEARPVSTQSRVADAVNGQLPLQSSSPGSVDPRVFSTIHGTVSAPPSRVMMVAEGATPVQAVLLTSRKVKSDRLHGITGNIMDLHQYCAAFIRSTL